MGGWRKVAVRRGGGGPKGWWGPEGVGARRGGGGPESVGAPKGGAQKVEPQRVGAQNFALFLLSPATKFILSRGILVVTLKCARLFWLSCEAPAARSGGVAGVSHDSPRAQTCTFERGLQKTPPKFNEKTSQRAKRERNFWREREKKKSEFLVREA